ncbi:hypothetical protein RhiirA4_521016 [Rhizophagus irregularis]|uniref:Actin-like ATPase domain-containing protein n=1 Tax=Rhizophagus irregularis TaxID=588596 RepID=A0A2I1HQF2_9GLOM|nr:hypothetical protein RhiirA4_521016 [Rhizophagus irregularis]
MRECAYKACLINEENSMGLQFITKHEATSIHCVNMLREININDGNDGYKYIILIKFATFIMIVDCGSDTIELATQKLFKNHNLGEITKRNGDYCGGNFVDDEFVKFLSRKVGPSVIDLVRKNHYSQLQYMIQEFSRRVKFSFTGQQEDFMPFELDLYELCPVIRQYIKDSELDKMEVNECSCEAMILVGGFSESKYLQTRIKQEFYRGNINIIVPARPLTVIAEGAVQYGLMLDKLDELDKTTTISPRVFEKTYDLKSF